MTTLPALRPVAHPSHTSLQRNIEDQLAVLIDAAGWPFVLNALAANALAYAITSARDNAHASKVMLQVGNALAGLERRTDRERV
jgi:hypothetical protein